MSELFDVEFFLLGQANNEIKDNPFVYEPLCKKIDVVRKIYKFYSVDLSTKNSDEEIGFDAYRKILNKLVLYERADFKILNTALKLNDILFSKKIINDDNHEKNQNILVNKMRPFLYEMRNVIKNN